MNPREIAPSAQIPIVIRSQPDDTTCGPTCLDAVYRYYGDEIALERIIDEVGSLEQGGTLAVFLACHALERGYRARIYTYNLTVFDPSWFQTGVSLQDRLTRQRAKKRSRKLRVATDAYLEFLERGGEVRFRELTPALIGGYLERSIPLLTGLSATYLYLTPRELARTNEYDDILGDPTGHFVVLCGYDSRGGRVRVADPLLPNPMSDEPYYFVDIHRLVGAVYLGVLTYDANFLVLEPGREPST